MLTATFILCFLKCSVFSHASTVYNRPLISVPILLWVTAAKAGLDMGREPAHIQRERALELPGRASPSLSTHSHSSEPGREALIQPKKLINPVKVSRSHQALHRELLLSHRWDSGQCIFVLLFLGFKGILLGIYLSVVNPMPMVWQYSHI